MKYRIFAVLCAVAASAALLSACAAQPVSAPAVNGAPDSVAVSTSASAPLAADITQSESAPESAVSAVTEPAVMKRYALPEGFVYVDDVVPGVALEIRYATAHNFTAAPIDGYEQPLAVLTTQAAEALKIAAEIAAKDGWHFRIYDAYRPQQALDCIIAWEQTDDTAGKAEFYPNMEKSALFTDGYLSKRSRHTRGSTVDLTLEDADGNLIDMGGPYDLLDPQSNYGAAGLTDQQDANRAYLCDIMQQAGFTPIATEWWHFDLPNEPYPTTYFDFPVA